MALVELPPGCLAASRGQATDSRSSQAKQGAEAAAATSADAKFVQDMLHHNHAVESPVKCIGGRLYVRISGMAPHATLQSVCSVCPSQAAARLMQPGQLLSFAWRSQLDLLCALPR